MRWSWPFLIYPPVVLLHLGLLAVGASGAPVTKALLMPALLLAVVLTVGVTARPELFRADATGAARGRVLAVALLLALGIVASWFGDILLGPYFVVGLASFGVAHLLFIAAFNGPAAARRLPGWTLAYVPLLALALVLLWPHLGELRVVVAGYGIVLALTAMTAARVSGLTALGGGLFLASDTLLAFRLFQPGFVEAFPDPWQDLLIMVLYCAGEGLIALGVLRRLADRSAAPAV
ncbi:MAG TPA: lysoplasmalogenase [Microbacteriaceae bacterium]|nr:lysoplasmalogenase [Microbacteriaceae bacterium]